MRKVTQEQIVRKREEIVSACEHLYQTMSFREITLKEIGNLTSFSRPTIYNYFETKEEIFLGLFQREYDRWNEDLTAILNGNEQMTKAELAGKIAASLSGREQLLKLLSMNFSRSMYIRCIERPYDCLKAVSSSCLLFASMS